MMHLPEALFRYAYEVGQVFGRIPSDGDLYKIDAEPRLDRPTSERSDRVVRTVVDSTARLDREAVSEPLRELARPVPIVFAGLLINDLPPVSAIPAQPQRAGGLRAVDQAETAIATPGAPVLIEAVVQTGDSA
jgi:hypothetical protein